MANKVTAEKLSAKAISRAWSSVNDLITEGKNPAFFGNSTTLDPDWRKAWYGKCSSLCLSFDYLKNWQKALEERPAEKDGPAFVQATLNGMLTTLDLIKKYLEEQLKYTIQDLEDELEECERKLAEYKKVELAMKAAAHPIT